MYIVNLTRHFETKRLLERSQTSD